MGQSAATHSSATPAAKHSFWLRVTTGPPDEPTAAGPITLAA